MKNVLKVMTLSLASFALAVSLTGSAHADTYNEKGGGSGRAAGGAVSDNIKDRLGVFGFLGFHVPADSDFSNLKINTDISFIGGGGVLYGVTREIALEFDIAHTEFGSSLPNGGNTGDFSVTNLAFGAQYRFSPTDKITPYAGAGIDILINDYDRGDVDTVVGVHISGGAEYFIQRDLALTAELRAVLAPDADIKVDGDKVGNFSPPSISGLFGVRYFF